ncbi:hypothetical protein BT93_E2428 [Corymbia citriodora subsp. variegata]|nr:hypothetical protein BT93_E2428 [Corymbia citriodora subsp. variegata]
MTNKNWEVLIAHAKTCPLNGNRYEDNQSDSGRQLTDHNGDRVHRADDKFSPKQENNEDTIGKASSSFPSQVSEQQTGNPAPAQHNMAPSTCPVGVEAPRANVGSTAEGHDDATALPSSIKSQDTTKDPANEASPPRQPTRESQTRDLVSPFNSQATMPSHGIGSSSQMDYTSKENVPPSGPPCATVQSFQNALFPRHNGATASPLLSQSQSTSFENPMMSPANESVPLALHQLISTDCLSAIFSRGDNGIATMGLPKQPHDTNSQATTPGQEIGSSSRMDYTSNENVPLSGPPRASIPNFQNGKSS